MNLGPHAAFIWFSYGAVASVVLVMIAVLYFEGRRLAAELARLEADGIRRADNSPPGGATG